jgi:hypothetical protein
MCSYVLYTHETKLTIHLCAYIQHHNRNFMIHVPNLGKNGLLFTYHGKKLEFDLLRI